LDLKFEGLKFGKFIDKNNLSIDIDELIIIIKNHSQKLSLDEQQIKQDLSDALCKVLGTLNATDVKKEDLERDLRLAYELSYFYQTQIYQLMVNWQSNHHPYKILALPALVGKMYSKIHFSRARGWNEPQRHKGHKDRSILCQLNLSHRT
jgi:hypothetical protein